MAKDCYNCGQQNTDDRTRCLKCDQPLPPIADKGQRPVLDVSRVPVPAEGRKLLDRIGTEPRIRIYVETGSNKGHQSASVTVARKLLERLTKKNPKLVLEFLCNDEDAAAKTKSIIGGSSLDGVPVEVTTFGVMFNPSKVDFSFSGAIDDPVATFRRINTTCLIGLQPYGWAGGAEIALAGEKMVILSKGSKHGALPETKPSLFPMPFNQLPFTEKASAAPSSDWVPTKPPDLTVKRILDTAQTSLSKPADMPAKSERVYVCPLYGMGKGQPMEALGAQVWINIGTALSRIARTKGLPGAVLLLNLSKDLGSSPTLWQDVKKAFAQDPGVKVIDTLISANQVDGVLKELQGGLKLCICTVGEDKDQRTMDRAYRECSLPPIFEGQGSLTQVMPMGRPFIKYSSRAAVDPTWPADYLPVPGFETLVAGLQKVCNAVGEKGSSQTLGSALDGLSGLFLQMLDPQSIVSHYFRECRKVVVDDRFDRLLWAAEALARIDLDRIGIDIPKA